MGAGTDAINVVVHFEVVGVESEAARDALPHDEQRLKTEGPPGRRDNRDL